MIRRKRGAARALLWMFGFFALGQAALGVCVELGRVEWRDPELARKLDLLAAGRREFAGEPLLLMLGSSRALEGFDAGALRGWAGGQGGWAFNLGLVASGPMRMLTVWEQARRRGARPALALVEVLPALLNEPGPGRLSELAWLPADRLTTGEVRGLGAYHAQPQRLWTRWLKHRATAGYCCREHFLATLAPHWLPEERVLRFGEEAALAAMDRFGWQPAPFETVSPALRARLTDAARRQYAGAFRDFRVGAGAGRALRALIRRCRAESAPVVLVRMPEAAAFREWSAGMEEAVAPFLEALRREEGVEVIDAREWVPDGEFLDGHHLLPGGARRFTARLAAELASGAGGPPR